MKHHDALWLAAGDEGSAEGIGAGDSRVVTREPRTGAMPLLVVFGFSNHCAVTGIPEPISATYTLPRNRSASELERINW
jgi:hypothetical protein